MSIHRPLLAVMVLCIIFFLLDMNPFLSSDGSRALEAILDDELARAAAFARAPATLSTRRVIWTYRSACVLYIGLVTGTAAVFWQAAT